MKREIKVNFAGFSGDYAHDPDNFILNTLRLKYEVKIAEKPDYLFFSLFGNQHFNYDCVKIMSVGENLIPDFNICDYAIGFDFLDYGDRYLRLPLYQRWKTFPMFHRTKIVNDEEVTKRKFCSIVVSNTQNADPIRERLFKILSEYKQVDSGGRSWNNVGGPVPDKLSFIKQYKFNIAIENSCARGYTTEKILDAMIANAVPIYYGNEEIGRDFNVASFINIHEFKSLEDVVERIVYLDTHDDAYLDLLHRPWLTDYSCFDWQQKLLDFLSNIIDKPIEKAHYMPKYGAALGYREGLKLSRYLLDDLRLAKACSLYKRLKICLRT